MDETTDPGSCRGPHDLLRGIDRVLLVLFPATRGFGGRVNDNFSAVKEAWTQFRCQVGL
jgi:hypothetical protein